VKDLSWLVLAAVYGLLLCLAETPQDLCRDYIPRAGESCMYPTEELHLRDTRVCRCPRSRPCAADGVRDGAK
jgi:hypothetical protein